MITIKIDVLKIDKQHLFKGQKGTYLDCILSDKPSEYDDGYVRQSVSKEKHEAGEKGPVIGSWKHIQTKSQQAAPSRASHDDDEIPF